MEVIQKEFRQATRKRLEDMKNQTQAMDRADDGCSVCRCA